MGVPGEDGARRRRLSGIEVISKTFKVTKCFGRGQPLFDDPCRHGTTSLFGEETHDLLIALGRGIEERRGHYGYPEARGTHGAEVLGGGQIDQNRRSRAGAQIRS